ncbi:MAG: hypothetical protein Q7J35_03160 [Candidatus Methanoperedens sp.]|nr:hypothetical protein [Candidatus Methanoperedens sp.]
MSKENIRKLTKELYHYIISNNRIEPFVFLYGQENKKGGIWKIKNLSISSDDSQLELIKIMRSYREKINNYIDDEFDFHDINNGNGGSLFYKIMDKDDLNKTKRISTDNIETDDITDFLKTNKFKNVFFIIEINLNESGNKKIILLKSVSQNYYAKKNRFTISLFDKRQRIKFLENKKDLLLDENFEIAAFIDNSQSVLFNWNEIPGNDSGILIDFLEQNYSVDSAKTAKIEKIDNGNTIRIYVEKNILSLSLNNEKTKVNLKIDNSLTDEFIAKMENGKLNIYSQSFFFITDREKFEDLYEYHEIYEKAYDVLAKNLDFIDWRNAKVTIPVLRSCYSIANFVRLNDCILKLKTELTSTDNNTIKKALKAKGIEYIVENENLEIIPQNTSKLKSLLKIITDGVAKTCLLDRDVIGSDFEELT